MAKILGETFQSEINAVGLSQINVAGQTLFIRSPLSTTDLDNLITVYNAHDSTKKLIVPVTQTQLRVQLALMTVPAGCPATLAPYNIAAGTNLYTAVSEVINVSSLDIQIRWNAPKMERTDPAVAAIGTLFNYSSADLDNLWILAAAN